MHKMHDGQDTKSGSPTTGAIIHKASQYDFHTRLLGLGVNQSNSRMIAEMAKIKPGEKVLDLGCGSGNLTLTAKIFTDPSGLVYGIDGSPEMIEVARKKARQNRLEVYFEIELVEKLSYQQSTFDVVISRLVFHHLPDDVKRQGFKEVLRVLKPGGRVFLADFKPPTNPLLAHLASALVGHPMMMQSNVDRIAPMLAEVGFVDVVTGPTRSAFLAFISGNKPKP